MTVSRAGAGLAAIAANAALARHWLQCLWMLTSVFLVVMTMEVH